MGRLSASKRATSFGLGLGFLLGAAWASAEVVDLVESTPGSPVIEVLRAETGAANSAVADSDNALAGAGDRDATGASSSPIPEPGAWALIVLGFLGVGLGVYRKRKPRLASVAD